ncbi:ribonuclease III domain-containing protein [Paraphoma chrysanthemicola]|uniref:Ribonuclease III domain-containing protein n=1 Tax=Paraphoma chrysanthemicola TaxID=798071 RepID=A0A8K0W3M5_9PLEO|nr:ribonuclease III domain-containing protein [Paraphoma chrysanthemicola]
MDTVEEKIAKVEEIIGYSFTDKLLCAEALQTAGAPNNRLTVNGTLHAVNKNDRLAILGDSVMTVVLCEFWYGYQNGQGSAPIKGQWDSLRLGKLSNAYLGQLGTSLEIDRLIFLNPGMSRASLAMIATAFEALLGAVHKDAGFNGLDAVRIVMNKLDFNDPALLN